MAFTTKFLTLCFVLCILAPAVFGIECYLNETETTTGCKYCLYANIAGQSISQSFYDCLQQLSYQGQTIPNNDVNKCLDQDLGVGKGKVYVCDKNLCNDHCDGVRVGFGIVAIIAIVASAVLPL
uniref:Protein quiver n=1 Tax=Panagrellus redivivus TaxID=6233 RepID=A0A7E4W6J4_PANRE